jgi:glycosyltransferase involved in cell wall biosynthesis
MRVAIVHFWLVNMRGGEKVLEALLELYPQADVYTNVFDPAALSAPLAACRVTTTFINRLPLARTKLPWYVPLMPIALEQLDLQAYDLVISSESGPAKGVLTRPDAVHVCYVHSPMRYVWDMQGEYLRTANPIARPLMRLAAHYLRFWDYTSAQRPHVLLANSRFTRARIAAYWRREAHVVFPPVDTARFDRVAAERGDYFLCLGALESYKRVDLAVEACEVERQKLLVIGEGPELARLQRAKPKYTTLLGRLPDEEVTTYVARCRALIFPGVEDFGIVPVEAMAAGRPVIAFGQGGAAESVVDGTCGIHFAEQSASCLAGALRRFVEVENEFEPARIAAHAATFDGVHFKRRFQAAVDEAVRAAAADRAALAITAGAAAGC